MLHCLCQNFGNPARVRVVVGAGCLDCNLHDCVAVAAAAAVVVAEAADSHRGLSVGHGLLLHLLWD